MIEKIPLKTFTTIFLHLIVYHLCFAQVENKILFYPDSKTSDCTPFIDVPLKVNNFRNIISMQGTISWDTSSLSYNRIVNFSDNIPVWGISNLGLSLANIGHLIFLWTDYTLEGINLNDSAELLTIRFDIKAKNNTKALISPGNEVIALEFVNKDLQELPVDYDSALITISKDLKAYSPFPTEIITMNSFIELDAGENFSAYLWSNGDTTRTTKINENGKYSVMVTNDIYCTGSAKTVVNVGPRPDTIISLNNGNWNDPDSWVNGYLPVSGSNVIVNNNVTISEDRECNTIELKPGSQVTILPGKRLNILKRN